MHSLETRIPPAVVAIAAAAVTWGIAALTEGVDATHVLRLASAIAVAALGAFFCIAGVVSFRRARTTVNPMRPGTASSLVDSGIYRITRNPMYLGFALFLVALVVYLASPAALLGVAAFVLYIDRFQIQPEERALAALFGEAFERYRNTVRRWI
jgi:protein-S-isoprenylcysteine O-methyltransferase Ste14